MTNHPRRSRSRLAEYGAKLRTVDGAKVVEMVDPNDGAGLRHQYRRAGDGIERRTLAHDGQPMTDTGSPWEPADVRSMRAVRGTYHPVLDPLGL